MIVVIDDTTKVGLTIFWELFTVVPYAPNHLKSLHHRYLKTFGSKIETDDFVKVEEGILQFLAQNIKRQQS